MTFAKSEQGAEKVSSGGVRLIACVASSGGEASSPSMDETYRDLLVLCTSAPDSLFAVIVSPW